MKGAGEDMKTESVILTGGGTAGHITPLLAVAKELHRQFPDIELIYIGQKGDKNESVVTGSGLPIKVKRILAGKYRRYPTQSTIQKVFNLKRHILNSRDVIYTLIGFIQSLFLIIKIRPRAVFVKGGFVGVPIGLASGLTRRRLITHDSDVLPGLANRIVGPFATAHAVATEANYPYKKNKTVVTGIPVRKEYYDYAENNGKDRARQELGFRKDDLILFIGGSTQGAKKIDDTMEQIVPELLAQFKHLHIIQVFGRLNEASMDSRYKDLATDYQKRLHLHGFLHDNYRYMAASDVLIGRAGATFIAEAAVLSSPCIIIPAPQLTGGHQLENARVLADNNAVIVIDEKDLTTENIKQAVVDLLTSKQARDAFGSKLHNLERTDAAKAIVSLIMNR